MPRVAVAVVLVALVALSASLTYAGFLVVGTVSHYLGTGRFAAGLLLGALFARLPYFSQGKFRTVGILPSPARRPLMIALLAFCLLHFLYRGAWMPTLFLGFATAFLLAAPWARRKFVARAMALLFGSAGQPGQPARRDNPEETVIDVEFREKKD
ncbi:MAG TPA: hypothetical protein VIM12_13855 [Noviherbaspirillum sp.]|jgi:peptidoglycan/LPS O-acetylase OafA/YrhL|uniref:hypothetical protein n=1 Tax=Noviherbaspirillum sp. TaxID=1926288 RepID=UPI002F950C1C